MDSSNKSNNEKKELKHTKSYFFNIKNKYNIINVFSHCIKLKTLRIVQLNKNLQKILDLTFDDYAEYSKIEIEIIPIENRKQREIFIHNESNESFYHIYFNDDKEEIKRNYLTVKDENVSKIIIRIDYQIN